jgi:hypothetical protein
MMPVAECRSLPDAPDHSGGRPDGAVAAAICEPVIRQGRLAESGQRLSAKFSPEIFGLRQFCNFEGGSRFEIPPILSSPAARVFVSFRVSSSLTNFALRSAITPSAARLPSVRPTDFSLRRPLSLLLGSLPRLALVAVTTHHRRTSSLTFLTVPRPDCDLST